MEHSAKNGYLYPSPQGWGNLVEDEAKEYMSQRGCTPPRNPSPLRQQDWFKYDLTETQVACIETSWFCTGWGARSEEGNRHKKFPSITSKQSLTDNHLQMKIFEGLKPLLRLGCIPSRKCLLENKLMDIFGYSLSHNGISGISFLNFFWYFYLIIYFSSLFLPYNSFLYILWFPI